MEEVVQRHLEARGGLERLRSIETLVYSGGTYREGDFVGSGRAFMAFQSPFLRVVGDPEDPRSTFREGYDGSAWEWFADPGIVVRTVGAANRAARHGTRYRGPFFDYRARGTTVELLGTERIGDRPAYDLLVTLRDGFRRHYFVDAESFLVTAERYEAPIHAFGEPVRTEARFSDYRPVAGVLFPFRSAEYDRDTGEELNSMEWGRIEANRELPRSWFSPPEYERTPLQELLENLYVQRTDPSAVLWTLADFRLVHPDMDVEAGLERIGYQMSKMGDHDAALAILEPNARDHPDSSSAAFALGRAYAAAGREDDARRELRRAVVLDPDNGNAKRTLEGLGAGDGQ